MQRVAVLSMHTSPLAQPGVGDGGGMNVYVRELVSSLASSGVDCTTYTRAWRAGLPDVVEVEPNHRVVHIPAGDFDMPKDELLGVVDNFTDSVAWHLQHGTGADIVHANYWLSGLVGHRLKHELNLPLVTTFHTFARVKGLGGDIESPIREKAELEIIGCADAICVSCEEEQSQFTSLYGNAPGAIEVVAPGVERAYFSPGDRRGARRALGLGDNPTLLFVGRIQPLKGLDVAVQTLAALDMPDAQLIVVGGASGTEGDNEMRRVKALIAEHKLERRVHFYEPQPHHLLSTFYRAADVVLVPSRSESFGLVALEASASGVPVVATGVGGLLNLIEHGRTGYLVPARDPNQFASFTARLLNDPLLALSMGTAAAERAKSYSWKAAAAKASRVYSELYVRDLVACS
ncbi:MAG: glycosyltransferase [Actinobacteria bacterium]|nr:glycosyltransferase [Actinomycetota bacterium]